MTEKQDGTNGLKASITCVDHEVCEACQKRLKEAIEVGQLASTRLCEVCRKPHSKEQIEALHREEKIKDEIELLIDKIDLLKDDLFDSVDSKIWADVANYALELEHAEIELWELKNKIKRGNKL